VAPVSEGRQPNFNLAVAYFEFTVRETGWGLSMKDYQASLESSGEMPLRPR
jgi:hypothetical protein